MKLHNLKIRFSNVFIENDIQTTCDVRYQFTCDNGRCLDNSMKCDGRVDCLDETDEVSCSRPGKYFKSSQHFNFCFAFTQYMNKFG